MMSQAITTALAASCPGVGVAGPFASPTPWTTYPAADGSQWRLDFPAGATAAQQQAAIVALAGYVDAPTVPPSVSNYQARTILIQRGLLTKVDAAIRGADQTVQTNEIALAAWDYANNFNRTDPLISAMEQVLGLSASDVDALFIAASAIGN